MITQIELKEKLSYNCNSGIFNWKIRPTNSIYIGQRAGTLDKDGYRYIILNGKKYCEHRLAWLYVIGIWPKYTIDHENRIRDDNKWKNLRPATRKDQSGNLKLNKRNKSGYRGISWNKKNKKWIAMLTKNNIKTYLGLYESKEEAYKVYETAAKEHFGEFYNEN